MLRQADLLKIFLDEEDKYLLEKYNWYISSCGYLSRHRLKKETFKKSHLVLHRILINAKEHEIVDHINGNKLDNRKCNLRICTQRQNTANSIKKKQGLSKYKGVYFFKRDKNWRAYIKVNYKQIHLGYFNNEIETAKTYDQAAIKYFKEFARLNFPNSV